MKLQLWSIYYDPVPMGIGPLAGTWSRAMEARGHDVRVLTSHPHYPDPIWGRSFRPRRRVSGGIERLEVPVPTGRSDLRSRLLQETAFTMGAAALGPTLGRPDAAVYVSPSFPGLAAMMLNSRMRQFPWVLWLQDVLPEGAVTTDLMSGGRLLSAAQRFELAAYESASHIVVISETFRRNLIDKGVRPEKVTRIYNPATLEVRRRYSDEVSNRVLVMGNIGLSQGLDHLIKAFEGDGRLADVGARLVLAGGGVAEAAARAASRTDRVEFLGVLTQNEIDRELARSAVGLVSQRPDITEFNLPSKLMNYLASGTPVIASVDPRSETAEIVRGSGGGWVADNRDMNQFLDRLVEVLSDVPKRRQASDAGLAFASRELRADSVATRFSDLLKEVMDAV